MQVNLFGQWARNTDALIMTVFTCNLMQGKHRAIFTGATIQNQWVDIAPQW